MEIHRSLLHLAVSGACLVLLPICIKANEPARFTNAERHLSAVIPDGWKQVSGTKKETALKLARDGGGNNIARIAIMTYAVDNATPGYDIWTMADEEIRSAGAEDSMSVLRFGRAVIDGVHVVWSLGRKQMLQDAWMWKLTYEGLRGSEGITVQLTVGGEEKWFAANETIFSEFVKTLRLTGDSTGSKPAPRSTTSNSFTMPVLATVLGLHVKIDESKRSSPASYLGKAYLVQFLKILGAMVVLGVGSVIYNKISRKPEQSAASESEKANE